MTNSLKTKLGRWAAGGLCAVLILSACSTPELPSLPFGSTSTPRPIEVTLFFTPPPAAETATPEPPAPELATATSAPAATPAPLSLPTTAPTALPTEPPAELPTIAPAPTETALPTLPVVEVAAPRVVTVVTTVLVTVTVITTAPPIAATPKLTSTSSLRTTRTPTPTLSAKSTSSSVITPTRTPVRPRPTAVPVVTVAPANLSSVLAVAYKSNIKSDPWGVPFNEDGCTQFDDRRAGRKVYLEIIVRPLIAGVNSWSAQFYQGGSPFPTCISDPYIQHGTLRERDIPARGYPLPFEISKTLIAFVPEGQAVTRLNLFANGKTELCFALSGASANEIPCGS